MNYSGKKSQKAKIKKAKIKKEQSKHAEDKYYKKRKAENYKNEEVLYSQGIFAVFPCISNPAASTCRDE